MFSLLGAIKHENNKMFIQYHYPHSSPESLKPIVNFASSSHCKKADSHEIIQYFRLDKSCRWVLYYHCFNLNHCLFIAGRQPYFNLYRALLRQINFMLLHVYDKGREEWPTREIEEFLDKVLSQPISHSFSHVHIPILGQMTHSTRLSLQNVMDVCYVDKDIFQDFVKNLNEEVLTNIFFWVLMGGRLFFHGRSSTRICHSVIAATSVIMPLKYQELVITLLPSADYLQSPYPCIFGVTEKMFTEAEEQGLIDSGYLVVDLESNRCRCEGASVIANVPPQIREYLRRELRKVIKAARRQAKSNSVRKTPEILEEMSKNIAKAFRTTCAAILSDYIELIKMVDDVDSITAKSFANVMQRKLPDSEAFYFELFGKSHIRHFLARRAANLVGVESSVPRLRMYEEFDMMCRVTEHDDLSKVVPKSDKRGVHWRKFAGQSRDVLQDIATKIQRKTKLRRGKNKTCPMPQRTSFGRNQACSDPSLFQQTSASLHASKNLLRCESNDILSCRGDTRPQGYSRVSDESSSDSLEDLHETYRAPCFKKDLLHSKPPRESRLMDVDAEMLAIKRRLEKEDPARTTGQDTSSSSPLDVHHKGKHAAKCISHSADDLLASDVPSINCHPNSSVYSSAVLPSVQGLLTESQTDTLHPGGPTGMRHSNSPRLNSRNICPESSSSNVGHIPPKPTAMKSSTSSSSVTAATCVTNNHK